jgi:anaerobic magnesium-protoporphyrin IX monomethyl ester cyclase
MEGIKRSALFTHSYFYKFDWKQWEFKQPYPPLATILAAAVMREAGFRVALFDIALRDSPAEVAVAIETHKPSYFIIYDDGFNYLTKMCLTNMREAAFEMARTAKEAGCIVIASSSDAADHYDKYLAHGVDYVVRGEGEETLKELLLALDANEDTSKLAGIAYRKESETITTPPRPVMRDLDALPLPAWDLVDIESYRQIWVKHHGYFSLNIATTRGCPYKCNWCAKPIYGNRYNSRSPQHVLREIEFLLKHYQPDHFWMCDDIFGLKPGWVQEFRDLAQAKKLKFRYKIQSRADLLLQEDTVQALAQSGAETIWVGAESGSQKILDAMDKGTTIQQIHDATRLMKQKGIKVAFFLQFGYLGETKEDIDATIAMVLELMPDEVGISVSYPLPGTKFYDTVKEQLREKQNWRDSDDLAMMFKSTFTSEYYKELHRYVHSMYRKRKGYITLKKLVRNPLRVNYKDLRTGLATFYYIPTAFAQRLKLKGLVTAGS